MTQPTLSTKFETLSEAFETATLQAEGHESIMKAPIFKNSDGTFEVGGMQHQKWNDISDGTFEEIGSVPGWDASEYDFGEGSEEMTDEEKAQEVFNQYGTEWFNDFCERYEIAEYVDFDVDQESKYYIEDLSNMEGQPYIGEFGQNCADLELAELFDSYEAAEYAAKEINDHANWYAIQEFERFITRDKEAGNVIDSFVTKKEAFDALKEYESTDRADNSYTPDFYEVYDLVKKIEVLK